MGRGTIEDLRTMLGDSDRLDPEAIETAHLCIDAVVSAANDYEPKRENRIRLNPNEIEDELKGLAASIQKVLKQIGHLSGESLWHIDLAMLPKADLDIKRWGKKKRDLLKSWFETDEWKFRELAHVAVILERLAAYIAKGKQPPSGSRSRSNWTPKPPDILLFTLAQNVTAMNRPLSHAKSIGDVVHQWATEDSPGNCISDRVWRRVQRLFREPKIKEQAPLTESPKEH